MAEESKETKEPEKELLDTIGQWKKSSEDFLKTQHTRWAKNTRLVRGIFEAGESEKSKVRNRSKIFWRKIWASNWRLLASLYQAFLKDPDSFKVEGQGGEDVERANVLTEMVKYRIRSMYKKNDLFRKLMWNLLDIVNLSDSISMLRWDTITDSPVYDTYSLDHFFPDPYRTTKTDMRYMIFRSYPTMDEMKGWGFKNLDKIQPVSREDESQMRQAREQDRTERISRSDSPDANYYPTDGSGDRTKLLTESQYEVWATLMMVNGTVHYTVTYRDEEILLDPQDTELEIYPVVFGSCLLVAHQLFGEGFPEPQEGPQISANATLNQRKDAVAVSLAPHWIVSRYGGVDLKSLANARVAGITLTDDVNAVRTEERKDVTGRAYMEVDSDDKMMQEMTAVTQQRQGFPGQPGEKATVANIAFQESGTRLDLFVGIAGETMFKDFYSVLTYMVSKFETDETVFRVANAKFKHKDRFDIDEFDADFIIKVGTPSINRQMEIDQTMMAMDRATNANQVTLGLVQAGALPPKKAKIFDVATFVVELLNDIGKKNTEKYIIGGLEAGESEGGGVANQNLTKPPVETAIG